MNWDKIWVHLFLFVLHILLLPIKKQTCRLGRSSTISMTVPLFG